MLEHICKHCVGFLRYLSTILSGTPLSSRTRTHIGPEVFGYISDDGDYSGQGNPSEEQIEFYNAHGFYIKLADYILRPEVLESNFYAWRATGDEKYLSRAVSAIDSFKTFLPATVAFAGINDV